MVNFIKNYKYQILLWFFILAYISYFSYFTILRYKTLYASYYDLGIMHQTVYNTYSAIKTGDWSRFLELTNPTGTEQIKRMAIHNDLLLAILAPFYFIHSGPETLLIVQSVIAALGAIAIFKISGKVLKNDFLSLLFSVSYLLYFPLQRANIFDFHAVTLATTFLLFMFYFWLTKKYRLSFIFFILSLLAKEQVALTTMMFGIYGLLSKSEIRNPKSEIITKIQKNKFSKRLMNLNFKNSNLFRVSSLEFRISLTIIIVSVVWFALSVFYIIPIFRGGQHFAVSRYSDFGESPIAIITGILTNPFSITKYIFRASTLDYLSLLFGPLGFLSLLSPIHLLIAVPEFAINLLSKNPNMKNIIYHYTAVITPFVFISAIYGPNKLANIKYKILNIKTTYQKSKIIGMILLIVSITFSYYKGPLPFSKEKNIHPFKYPQKEAKDASFWSKTLQDEKLKISSTGQLSPFFTSRRYFYTFSARYRLTDYVIVRLNEIYNYPEKNDLIPVYKRLREDYNYELIYQKENFEVYKKNNI